MICSPTLASAATDSVRLVRSRHALGREAEQAHPELDPMAMLVIRADHAGASDISYGGRDWRVRQCVSHRIRSSAGMSLASKRRSPVIARGELSNCTGRTKGAGVLKPAKFAANCEGVQ